MSTRRDVLAAALAGLAGTAAWGAQAPQLRLIEEGETQLAAGDAAAALAAFEQAAAMVHEPEVEMGIVRSHMQAGDYRRALAFCAHVAGAHREAPAGTALYAWLLHAGGHAGVAARVLAQALSLDPQDACLLAARDALALAWPRAQGVLLAPPQRMAPYATSATPEGRAPAAARVAGTPCWLPMGGMPGHRAPHWPARASCGCAMASGRRWWPGSRRAPSLRRSPCCHWRARCRCKGKGKGKGRWACASPLPAARPA